MKKIVYIFVAALLMVACKPNNEVVDGKVRLTVSMDDNQSNKSQQRISAIDNGSAIDLTWEEGDTLTAYDGTSGEKIGTFKLLPEAQQREGQGIGHKSAVFVSENFDRSIENFTLAYQGKSYDGTLVMSQEVTMTEKDGNRTYKLNKDYLKLEAKNCKIGGGIQMQPCFSLLGVQLKSKESCVFTGSVYLGKAATYCASKIGSSIDLQGGGIYYYVFPNDLAEDTKTKYLGEGSRIFLYENNSNASSTNSITLSKTIELNPYQATIVTLWVTKNDGGEGEGQYTLSKTQP